MLEEALNSVFQQSYKNWEVIIVDQNSTDGTPEVFANLNDPRVLFLNVINNGSIAASRNTGIRIAKGEWVAFLDSDDWWQPNKIEICLGLASHKVDILYHDMFVATGVGLVSAKETIKSRQLKNPIVKDLLLNGNTIVNSSVMVKRVILEKVGFLSESLEMKGTEDYNIWLKISTISERFLHIPQTLGFYRKHSQSISNSKEYRIPWEATEEFITYLSNKELNIMRINSFYTKARISFLNKDYNNARIQLKVVIKNGKFKYLLKSVWMIVILSVREHLGSRHIPD